MELTVDTVNEAQLEYLERKLNRKVRRRVRRGMKLLDKKYGPEWPQDISLAGLDLASGSMCVLGQLAPRLVEILEGPDSNNIAGAEYGAATNALWPELEGDDREVADRHGFCRGTDELISWRMLNHEWEVQIGARQRAAASIVHTSVR